MSGQSIDLYFMTKWLCDKVVKELNLLE